MLISEKAMVRWNGSTRKHYEDLGYIWGGQNNWFEVEIEHLMKTSPIKVTIKCDYCGKEFPKPYRDLFKQREIINKDCCKNRKCMLYKSEEVSLVKYGVKNFQQRKDEDFIEKKSLMFRTPKENILEIASFKGLNILNVDDYKNDRTRLEVVCNVHKEYGVQETNFANIKSNKHCCKYIRHDNHSKRLDGEIVVQAFIDHELIPLFIAEDYDGNSSPLPFICPKHEELGTQYRCYANLSMNEHMGCTQCSRELTSELLREDEQKVFSYFKRKGLIVCEGERYVNKEKHIKCYCTNHPNHILLNKSYSNLKNTQEPCDICRAEKSLSSLNRNLRSSIGVWRNKSELSCGCKCVLTGSTNYDVHHLYSFNKIILDSLEELKIDINNIDGENYIKVKDLVVHKHNDLLGVCLERNLHILFHQIYGKEINTVEQFEDFKIRYKSGELKEVIQ